MSARSRSSGRVVTAERAVLFGFVAALVLLALVAALSYQSTSRFLASSRQAFEHAQLAMPLHGTFAWLHAAESNNHAYLLTGEPMYLQRRDAALSQLGEDLGQLRSAAAGDVGLLERIAAIQALVDARVALMDRVLAVQRTEGAAQARALLAAGVGSAEIEALHRAVDELAGRWRAELLSGAAAADDIGVEAVRRFSVGILMAALLFGALMYLVRREIVARRRSNERLAAGEARLKAVVDTAVDAIIVIDSRGVVESYNRAAERMFGYAPDEVTGRNIKMLMPSPYREEHDGYLERYLRTGEKRIIGKGREVLGQRKDGGVFPITLAVAEFEHNGARHFSGVIRDISERKAAEERQARLVQELKQANEALAAGEARLDAVVETAVDAIIVIDERGIMERFNRAAERMFGYRADEVVGRNVSLLMPSPYREEHDGYLERYLRTGEKHIIGIGREVLGQRKDGSVFPLDLAVAEFRIGAQRRFSGLIRDISARKQAEARQAELVQELETANEELKNFAYIASHDLKAPLRAIGTLADWISADYADKFDDEGREQMRLLISRVQRMDRLIDGILQYSRVGRVREAREPVDLDGVVRDAIDLLAPPEHIHIRQDPLPTVVVERTRIQQVFQNLLSNAIRYMDKPDGRIRIGCESHGGEWRFSVADNGPGIEARHFERIFMLFQTLAPRDRTESTGIGLSLVKKIVEMYGGRVWVESTPGVGSTFFFSLPKAAVTPGE